MNEEQERELRGLMTNRTFTHDEIIQCAARFLNNEREAIAKEIERSDGKFKDVYATIARSRITNSIT